MTAENAAIAANSDDDMRRETDVFMATLAEILKQDKDQQLDLRMFALSADSSYSFADADGRREQLDKWDRLARELPHKPWLIKQLLEQYPYVMAALHSEQRRADSAENWVSILSKRCRELNDALLEAQRPWHYRWSKPVNDRLYFIKNRVKR